MPQLQQHAVRNRLLKAMSADDFALLQPHLQPMATQLRQTLIAPNEPVTRLFFPEVGYSSIVAEGSGGRIEVGIVGREGLVGASPVLLDSGTTPYHEFIQHPGEVLAIDATNFCAAVDHSPTLRKLMLRYMQTKLVQARHTAFMNGAFNMDVRLARWLLMCHDRLDGDEIVVTHEFISMMLGVQRSGATLAVQTLEGNHLIKAARGRITVRDRGGLLALADGGYGTPEAEYARLIGGV
jgi:CRP-like cAMP-binding protein